MYDFNAERINKLERRVARLEGKPDPGLPCKGTEDSDCHGGRVKVYDTSYKWGWGACPTCNGTGRVYPDDD